MATKKSPNPTDRYVGARVRMRRMMLSMSQEKLGDALDLTFQQVQKYEKGANRIGASRLQQIAHTLQVPVSFFFDGAPQTFETGAQNVAAMTAPTPDYVSAFCSTAYGITIARAFGRIKNRNVQAKIVALIEEIAGDEEEVPARKVG